MTINTNSELVEDLMDFSPFGPMSQMFIIEAIRSKADAVIANEKKLLQDEADGKTPFVSMQAWIGTAKDIKTRMNEFYTRFD